MKRRSIKFTFGSFELEPRVCLDGAVNPPIVQPLSPSPADPITPTLGGDPGSGGGPVSSGISITPADPIGPVGGVPTDPISGSADPGGLPDEPSDPDNPYPDSPYPDDFPDGNADDPATGSDGFPDPNGDPYPDDEYAASSGADCIDAPYDPYN